MICLITDDLLAGKRGRQSRLKLTVAQRSARIPEFELVQIDRWLQFGSQRETSPIDVYGTSIHIQQLASETRLAIVVLQCEPTTLTTANLSSDTVCPNQVTLAGQLLGSTFSE